jgi:hypothetical protein
MKIRTLKLFEIKTGIPLFTNKGDTLPLHVHIITDSYDLH